MLSNSEGILHDCNILQVASSEKYEFLSLQRLAAPCRLKKEAKKRSKAAAGGETAEAAVAGATEGAEGVPGDGEGATVPPQPVPNDPLNPLNAAYDMRAYALLRKLRLDEEHQISQVTDPNRSKQIPKVFGRTLIGFSWQCF